MSGRSRGKIVLARTHWLLLLAAAIVVLAALPVLTFPLGRDQGEFATIGSGILDGRVPYVQLWNPKPPAVFYTYALAMAAFGRTTMALRAIDLLIVPVICAALYWLGKRIASANVGLWAALIFPTFYFSESFWTLTQNDGIAILPMTLAMLAMFKASDSADARRGALWALICGMLCALTLWFKYPFALFVLALVVGYWLRVGATGQPPLRTHIYNMLAFTVGGLLIGVGGILYLASIGALDAWLQSAQVTAGYTVLGTGDLGESAESFWSYIKDRWTQWGLLFVLAALSPIIRRVGAQHTAPLQNQRRGWWVIWLWLIGAFAAMLSQLKGYDYHWLPMLPPLALLAAFTVERFVQFFDKFLSRSAQILIVFLCFCSIIFMNTWGLSFNYLVGQETQAVYYSRFRGGEFVADESLMVANYLSERVPSGDTLFIWGFRPEVYYLSRLNPATRFIFHFPLVADWYPPEWKQETVETLWAAQPPYVLVLQVDYMPWVTGSHADSHTLLQDYTELNNWLMFNYERETQIGNFLVWRRKS